VASRALTVEGSSTRSPFTSNSWGYEFSTWILEVKRWSGSERFRVPVFYGQVRSLIYQQSRSQVENQSYIQRWHGTHGTYEKMMAGYMNEYCATVLYIFLSVKSPFSDGFPNAGYGSWVPSDLTSSRFATWSTWPWGFDGALNVDITEFLGPEKALKSARIFWKFLWE